MESQIVQSAECGELYKALEKFQTLPISIGKNGQGNFGKHAKLEDVLEGIKQPLKESGLVVIQVPVGQCGLVTRIIHPESSQWLEGYYQMNPEKETPQGYGSVLTYQKRYVLVAMLCLNVDDDDDAQGGMKKTKPLAQAKPADTWPKKNAVVDKPVETVDSTPQESQLLCTWANGEIRVDTSKPTCPQCKMAMYDNRDKKASGEYSQTYGDFTCKDQKCTIESNGKNYRTGVWISKEQPSQEEDIIIEDEPPF